MQRKSLMFPPGLRVSFWLSLAVLFVSGAGWLTLAWAEQRETEASSHPLQPWLLRVHGGAAIVVVFIMGTVFVRHVLPAWAARKNRASGALVAASFALLSGSGYGLYYFSGETLRQWTSNVHNVLGLALPLALWLHVWRGRRLARSVAPTETE